MPYGMMRTRCAEGSTRTSTKLWKKGATLESKADDSHSGENGHASSLSVHHHSGSFGSVTLAAILDRTWSIRG